MGFVYSPDKLLVNTTMEYISKAKEIVNMLISPLRIGKCSFVFFMKWLDCRRTRM